MKLLSPDDLGIIFEAIENERDIIPFIPENVLAQLKGKAVYFDALSNVDFLLGLTDEIFPEYSELLRGKNGWLERQLSQLKEFI